MWLHLPPGFCPSVLKQGEAVQDELVELATARETIARLEQERATTTKLLSMREEHINHAWMERDEARRSWLRADAATVDALNELDAARAEAARLREALVAEITGGVSFRRCPRCAADTRTGGHEPGCSLLSALTPDDGWLARHDADLLAKYSPAADMAFTDARIEEAVAPWRHMLEAVVIHASPEVPGVDPRGWCEICEEKELCAFHQALESAQVMIGWAPPRLNDRLSALTPDDGWLARKLEEAVAPYAGVMRRMFTFSPALDARHRARDITGQCGSCGFPWPCPHEAARALLSGTPVGEE